ncbi:unnamed protein product [Rotaria sp. Silwood2]|nr:unnamed protein product [Rotaria sp. Silwood2]CAF3091948.1 unnamed protein product [Rotaria sp. Silwood2]CAF3359234.1 unnamed protein product [Rotaria sp. Silwood2]CAF3376206.1 unnamed protein product [Rotaria sp. Silwood2]CAF4224885.1 unnamed protein product [Rotaria sp. Silwood2]
MSAMELRMNGDITGEINFFSHTIDGCAPWSDATPTLGSVATNFARTPARVTIYDLRGKENTLDLDINGLEVHKYHGHIYDIFDDNSEIQQCYYEEIVNVLKNRLGASRVIVFNHIIRYRGAPRPANQCDPTHKNPVFYPHVDNDPPAAYFKLKEILGEEEAKTVMQKHFQIINVWRPLGPNPIINIPLTICDYQSLDPNNDLHSVKVRGSQSSISVYTVSSNIQNAQKWYYLSQMRSDEMFMFKIFDTNPNVAQFGAHTAFINEYVPLTDIEQCSIEVRCLVLYD